MISKNYVTNVHYGVVLAISFHERQLLYTLDRHSGMLTFLSWFPIEVYFYLTFDVFSMVVYIVV
jgi:hypothetical protein